MMMGGKTKTMGDKKPKAYPFTKNAGPQFNLLPDAEPMDYFSLFFNDELLNNIVTETNMYARHKFAELQLFFCLFCRVDRSWWACFIYLVYVISVHDVAE
jgi:hypothetical protein